MAAPAAVLPNAVFDEDQQRWISDAEVAEIGYTAFSSRAKADHVHARLFVRRVPDLNPANQRELFTDYRYHAEFTNSALCPCWRRRPRIAPTRSSSRSSPT